MNKFKVDIYSDRGLIKFTYGTNVFICKLKPQEECPNYLSISSTFTDKEDRNKGFLKKNLENMIKFVNDEYSLKGLVIFKTEQLSDDAKNVINLAVQKGWMKRIKNNIIIE